MRSIINKNLASDDQQLVNEDGTVQLPETVDLSSATVVRDGADLLITNGEGAGFFVSDYFTQESPSDLVSPNGERLSGQILNDMPDQAAVGQYAQVQIPGLEVSDAQTQQTLGEPIGTVDNAEGTVSVTRVDGTISTLSIGDKVYQGDVLETGGAGGVGITLADTSSFSLGEESEMVLDELVYDPGQQEGSTILSLMSGTASYVSGQIAKINPDAVSINTPVATIGIRGTKVFLEYVDGQFKVINLMETTLSGETPGEIVIIGLDGIALGSTNEANIGWSWNGKGDSAITSVRLTSSQVETLTQKALSHLPRSLAEQANDAIELEKTLKEAAEVAAEEAADAEKEALEAEQEAQELDLEAKIAQEQVDALLSETELGETALEEATLLLENLINESTDTQAILMAQVELNKLEANYESLMANLEAAQRITQLVQNQAKHANDVMLDTQEEYRSAYDAAQLANHAVNTATLESQSAFKLATTYVGYETNTGRTDTSSTIQVASLVENPNTPENGGPIDEKEEKRDEEGNSIFIEHEVILNDGDDQATVYTPETFIPPTPPPVVTIEEGETETPLETTTSTTDTVVVETVQLSTFTGIGVDGYLSGATVFVDLDGDGIVDAGEDFTTTDTSGNFSLSTSYTTHALSITGGTDIATGEVFYGVLKAPAGSSVITPLTTVLTALMDAGSTKDEAQTSLATAFGFTNNASLDLTGDDPIAGASGDSNYAQIAAIGVQLQNTVLQAASAIQGASSSVDDGATASAIFDALAASITSQGASFNISDSTNLQNVITIAATSVLSGAELNTATNAAASTASVISSSNSVIDGYISLGGTGSDFLSSIAQVAVVANNAAGELKTAINDGTDLSTLQSNYSSANLTSKIEAAPIGDVNGDGTSNVVNAAPVISGAVALSTNEDEDKNISREDLLGNTTDADTATNTLVIKDVTASSGTLITNENGTWTVRPEENSIAPITLSYTVSDGFKSTATTANITVVSVNDTPEDTDDSDLTVSEGQTINLSEDVLLSTITDVESDDLSVTGIAVAGGTFEFIPDEDNDSWIITPDDDDETDLIVTYDVSDGGEETLSATETIIVNDAPVAADSTATALEDGNLLSASVSATDAEGSNLTYNLVGNAISGLTFNSNGSYTFDPSHNDYDDLALDATQDITFTYQAHDDQGATDQGNVTITLTGTNDAPTVSAAESFSGTEDTVITLSKAQLLNNATDVDGDSLSISNLSITGGTITENDNETWTITPDANSTSDVNLSYTVNDPSNASVNQSATISLASVNDAPVLSSVSLSDALEDVTYTLNESDLLASNVASDVDGDTLSITNITVAHEGSATNNNDGTWSIATPSNYNGTTQVTYTVSDGTTTTSNTVNLTYASVNDAPIISSTLVLNGVEDQVLTLSEEDLLSFASDIEGSDLSVENVMLGDVSLSTNDAGDWIYTPSEGGSLTFSYDVSDGVASTSTTATAVILSAEEANAAPTVSGATALTGSEDGGDAGVITITQAQLIANASDDDSDTLYVQSLSTTDGGTLINNNDGTWAYTPVINSTSDVTFTYTITDGIEGVSTSATLSLSAVNDAPSVSDPITLDTSDEDVVVTLTTAELIANVSDVDDDTFSVENLTASSGTLENNGDNTWSFTPVPDSVTGVTFSYEISDGEDTVATTAALSINAVADAPDISFTMGEVVNVTIDGDESEDITINNANVTSSGNGFTVTARIIDDNGDLSDASTDNVGIYTGDPNGFGADGSEGSGHQTETGYNNPNRVSEQLIVSFDTDVSSADVSFAWMHSREDAYIEFYLNGAKVGDDNVDGLTDGIEDAITLSPDNNSQFDQIIFSAPGRDDDFLIHSIEFETENEDQNFMDIPIYLSLTETDDDGSETLSDITLSSIPEGASIFVDDVEATISNNSLTLASDNLDNVKIRVPEGFDDFDMIATATSSENNDTATTAETLDYIFGEGTDDVVTLESGNVVVNGGEGSDTVRFASGLDLDFSIDNVAFWAIENIDMATDTGVNNLTLSSTDVINMVGDAPLVIDMDGTDTLNLSDGVWTQGEISNGYTTYDHDTTDAQVQVTSPIA